ncbi:antibiotic biosynthesis monooxygenase [Streptomyces luteireticuli]|uniref:antibiotic biosynthesis monooxygenase family protein n=1 Tax=Streptomyces luteireticuli TaxID=173858 RepID=UPI003555DE01
MIRAVLTMVVREGCERAFEKAWLDAAAVTRTMPGAVAQTMLRDPGTPRRYVITADWLTPEHLTVYQDSDRRHALSAALEPLRESATRELLEIVAHFDPGTEPEQGGRR